MSRLSPKKVFGGVFPEACWLGKALPLADQNLADPDGMLAALVRLLEQTPAAVVQGGRVTLVVSDTLAVFATLPWQEELRTVAEIDAYASACFALRGHVLSDEWAMHAEFRSHRQGGLAYALPMAWIERLGAALTERGLVLERVLPLSAWAYWKRGRRLPKSGHEIVLLSEACRHSALIYGPGGLMAMDVEPVLANAELSLKGLLTRVAAFYPDVNTIEHWPAGTEGPLKTVPVLSEAALQVMPRENWNT